MSSRLILCNIVWSQHVQKFRRENSLLQTGKEPTCLVVGLGEFEQVFGVVIHVHVSLDSGSDPLQLDNELFACTSSVANTRLSFMISPIFNPAFRKRGKQRSQNQDARSGNRTQDLLHQGRTLTDCAILAPPCSCIHTADGLQLHTLEF